MRHEARVPAAVLPLLQLLPKRMQLQLKRLLPLLMTSLACRPMLRTGSSTSPWMGHQERQGLRQLQRLLPTMMLRQEQEPGQAQGQEQRALAAPLHDRMRLQLLLAALALPSHGCWIQSAQLACWSAVQLQACKLGTAPSLRLHVTLPRLLEQRKKHGAKRLALSLRCPMTRPLQRRTMIATLGKSMKTTQSTATGWPHRPSKRRRRRQRAVRGSASASPPPLLAELPSYLRTAWRVARRIMQPIAPWACSGRASRPLGLPVASTTLLRPPLPTLQAAGLLGAVMQRVVPAKVLAAGGGHSAKLPRLHWLLLAATSEESSRT